MPKDSNIVSSATSSRRVSQPQLNDQLLQRHLRYLFADLANKEALYWAGNDGRITKYVFTYILINLPLDAPAQRR